MNKKIFILLAFIYSNYTKNIKIALGQIEVLSNRPEQNVNKMLKMIEEAKQLGADIIIFPELCVSGYLLGDKWLNKRFCKQLMSFNELIKMASSNITVVYGNIYLDTTKLNDDGSKRKYNAAYIYSNSQNVKRSKEYSFLPTSAQSKTLLPNYRIFDDQRYFYSTLKISQENNVNIEDLLQPFEVIINNKILKIGLEVCEDIWCKNYSYKNGFLNPTKILIQNGADIIINISASPWNYGKNEKRNQIIKFLKHDIGDDFKPLIYVNNVGTQNNGKNIVTFDGNSSVYNKNGDLISDASDEYKERLIIFEDFEQEIKTHPSKSKIEQKFSAILYGLRHLKNIMNKDDLKFVIGVSGGIDSAVVISLLSLITNVQNIMAVNMPTKFNSTKTINIAKKICENLGIKLLFINIQNLTDSNTNILQLYDEKKFADKIELNNENIMAKIRGTSILSNLAQRHDAILVNNGNKLEIALGYATLYGDVNGAIAPIGDLTKEEVFELARYLNKVIFRKEVIPNLLIPDENFEFSENQMPPSAELKENQIDPMKFGYHDKLLEALTTFPPLSIDDIANFYYKGNLIEKLNINKSIFKRYNLDNPKIFFDDLEWFIKLFNNSVFKRIQSPPIIITSRSSFGFDIRESQLPLTLSKYYKDIKSESLSGKLPR